MLGGTVWEGLGDVVLYGENVSLRVGFVVINCFDIFFSSFPFSCCFFQQKSFQLLFQRHTCLSTAMLAVMTVMDSPTNCKTHAFLYQFFWSYYTFTAIKK